MKHRTVRPLVVVALLASACSPLPTSDAGAEGGMSDAPPPPLEASTDGPATDAPAADATPDVATPDDTGGTDGAASDSGGTDAGGAACGAAPYFTVAGMLRDAMAHTPLPGATLTITACPTMHYTTDAAGMFSASVTGATPIYLRAQATGYLTRLSEEATLLADPPVGSVDMIATTLTTFLPGYTATAGTVFIETISSDGTGACADRSGVTFSVTGHPEARVEYYLGPPPATRPTATGTNGQALITGITLSGTPTYVTVVGTKPGCAIHFGRTSVSSITSDHVPLEAGAISAARPSITNP